LRILAATDFHGDRDAFRRVAAKARDVADVVVVCGDVTHFGLLVQARQLLSSLLDLEAPVLFVPGNCDVPSLAIEKRGNVESIHGKCRTLGGVSFVGVGGSPPGPFNAPFELEETEIARILEEARSNCHPRENMIVVSHTPPRDTRVDRAFNGEHVGSCSVREFVEKNQPDLLICGHIHEAKGVDRVGETLIVNPGPARHGSCAVIDLISEVEVRFDRL
jgi:Icc-related predicted phosphoesterase